MEDAPRRVKHEDLFEDTEATKIPKDVASFLGKSLGVLCDLMQTLDPCFEQTPEGAFPIWPMGPEERAENGEALATILKDLPASQKKSVAKLLNKNVPTLMACIVLGKSLGPRVKFSLDSKRQQRTVSNGVRTVAQAPTGNGNGQSSAQGGGAAKPSEAANAGVYSGTAAGSFVADAFDSV